MKITILGAAGVRTPLLIRAISERSKSLGIHDLALMDIDLEKLNIMQSLIKVAFSPDDLPFNILWTTDPEVALSNSDYVITTFRVGGMESRIIDERVPLQYGILGQETTGAGGFAMALRTIPVLLDYIEIMRRVCPNAWILNFANPSGLLTQAIQDLSGWKKAVGICDAPDTMRRIASGLLGVLPEQIMFDYFGLNHLGWVRGVYLNGQNYLPIFIDAIKEKFLDLPFSVSLIKTLGMIPNEYLFYYYSSKQAVANILKGRITRGEQISQMNKGLFGDLIKLQESSNFTEMNPRYQQYLAERGETYMTTETGSNLAAANPTAGTTSEPGEGYGHVALNIIEALQSNKPGNMILNTANKGSILNMEDDDVVEIPVLVQTDKIEPIHIGKIPDHSCGLMKQVKAFEKLTLEAYSQKSYAKALLALITHPLIMDEVLAKDILDDYIRLHGFTFF